MRTVSTSVPTSLIAQLEAACARTRLTMGTFNGLMLQRGFALFLQDGQLENPVEIEPVDIEKEHESTDLTETELWAEQPDYVMTASR